MRQPHAYHNDEQRASYLPPREFLFASFSSSPSIEPLAEIDLKIEMGVGKQVGGVVRSLA